MSLFSRVNIVIIWLAILSGVMVFVVINQDNHNSKSQDAVSTLQVKTSVNTLRADIARLQSRFEGNLGVGYNEVMQITTDLKRVSPSLNKKDKGMLVSYILEVFGTVDLTKWLTSEQSDRFWSNLHDII